MIHFQYKFSIRGSVHMFGLLYVHQEREDFSSSLYLTSLQGSNCPLTNFVNYPVSLLHSAPTSLPSYLAGKGSSRLKNPEHYRSDN